MPRTIISVCYKNKDSGEFGGRAYSYYSDIPAKVGDIVIAPTAKGESVAMVSEIDVPESRIDERVLSLLKTITAYAEKEA